MHWLKNINEKNRENADDACNSDRKESFIADTKFNKNQMDTMKSI